MSGIVAEFLRSLISVKTCVFCFPLSSEPGIVSETQVLCQDKEANERDFAPKQRFSFK